MAVATAATLALTSVSGCYVYEPTTASELDPAKSIAVDLNDLGRLSLAPVIGPEVKRIAGSLVTQTSSAYVVRVTELVFFNGKEAVWNGEPVTVNREYVRTLYGEKISPERTGVAIAAGLAAVAGIIGAKIAGGGNGSSDTKGTGTGTASRGSQ